MAKAYLWDATFTSSLGPRFENLLALHLLKLCRLLQAAREFLATATLLASTWCA